jgi:hypothetical protein
MNNWEDELEWESMDIIPDIVIKEQLYQNKLEEKKIIQKKIEESDNKLTDELFGKKLEEPKISSIKEKGVVVINKMKSSGIKLVDNLVKKNKKTKKEI